VAAKNARHQDENSSPFQALPSVTAILSEIEHHSEVRLAGDPLTAAISTSLSKARARISAGECLSREEIVQSVMSDLQDLGRARLRPVINATGVIIHTNLGRSMVSSETAEAMATAAASYVALEIDPESNERGGRMSEISALMRLLTGAGSALVVNNNAAAVLLVLSTVAEGRSVVLSRGEAVEIGGGFRIPDVMRQSGARLIEVGTTNRTYARDYELAIDDTTAALLKVHPSNFQISGFVHTTSIEELAPIGRARHIPVIEDLGSGALIDTAQFGLMEEPTIRGSLAAGASIVMASGDKLLGGPQAGLIAGTREWLAKIERNPLARAVRADKTCLAGVAATLRHYANGEAIEKIPVWRMIGATEESLNHRAIAIVDRLGGARLKVGIRQVNATIGGGSLPGQELPSYALAIKNAEPDVLARRLRIGTPSVFGRVENQEVLLDLRSVLPEQDNDLVLALHQVLGKDG
jgi:L-seryl-tRNA(Ser) seleniumtransferase